MRKTFSLGADLWGREPQDSQGKGKETRRRLGAVKFCSLRAYNEDVSLAMDAYVRSLEKLSPARDNCLRRNSNGIEEMDGR